MLRLMKMFGGVLILRRVAAAYVTALETQAQMHPGVMHLKTFLAAFAAGSNFLDLFLMTARFRHDFASVLFRAQSLAYRGVDRERLKPVRIERNWRGHLIQLGKFVGRELKVCSAE